MSEHLKRIGLLANLISEKHKLIKHDAAAFAEAFMWEKMIWRDGVGKNSIKTKNLQRYNSGYWKPAWKTVASAEITPAGMIALRDKVSQQFISADGIKIAKQRAWRHIKASYLWIAYSAGDAIPGTRDAAMRIYKWLNVNGDLVGAPVVEQRELKAARIALSLEFPDEGVSGPNRSMLLDDNNIIKRTPHVGFDKNTMHHHGGQYGDSGGMWPWISNSNDDRADKINKLDKALSDGGGDAGGTSIGAGGHMGGDDARTLYQRKDFRKLVEELIHDNQYYTDVNDYIDLGVLFGYVDGEMSVQDEFLNMVTEPVEFTRNNKLLDFEWPGTPEYRRTWNIFLNSNSAEELRHYMSEELMPAYLTEIREKKYLQKVTDTAADMLSTQATRLPERSIRHIKAQLLYAASFARAEGKTNLVRAILHEYLKFAFVNPDRGIIRIDRLRQEVLIAQFEMTDELLDAIRTSVPDSATMIRNGIFYNEQGHPLVMGEVGDISPHQPLDNTNLHPHEKAINDRIDELGEALDKDGVDGLDRKIKWDNTSYHSESTLDSRTGERRLASVSEKGPKPYKVMKGPLSRNTEGTTGHHHAPEHYGHSHGLGGNLGTRMNHHGGQYGDSAGMWEAGSSVNIRKGKALKGRGYTPRLSASLPGGLPPGIFDNINKDLLVHTYEWAKTMVGAGSDGYIKWDTNAANSEIILWRHLSSEQVEASRRNIQSTVDSNPDYDKVLPIEDISPEQKAALEEIPHNSSSPQNIVESHGGPHNNKWIYSVRDRVKGINGRIDVMYNPKTKSILLRIYSKDNSIPFGSHRSAAFSKLTYEVERSIAILENAGAEVERFTGIFINDMNFSQYNRGIELGLTPMHAAVRTQAGRLARALGFNYIESAGHSHTANDGRRAVFVKSSQAVGSKPAPESVETLLKQGNQRLHFRIAQIRQANGGKGLLPDSGKGFGDTFPPAFDNSKTFRGHIGGMNGGPLGTRMYHHDANGSGGIGSGGAGGGGGVGDDDWNPNSYGGNPPGKHNWEAMTLSEWERVRWYTVHPDDIKRIPWDALPDDILETIPAHFERKFYSGLDDLAEKIDDELFTEGDKKLMDEAGLNPRRSKPTNPLNEELDWGTPHGPELPPGNGLPNSGDIPNKRPNHYGLGVKVPYPTIYDDNIKHITDIPIIAYIEDRRDYLNFMFENTFDGKDIRIKGVNTVEGKGVKVIKELREFWDAGDFRRAIGRADFTLAGLVDTKALIIRALLDKTIPKELLAETVKNLTAFRLILLIDGERELADVVEYIGESLSMRLRGKEKAISHVWAMWDVFTIVERGSDDFHGSVKRSFRAVTKKKGGGGGMSPGTTMYHHGVDSMGGGGGSIQNREIPSRLKGLSAKVKDMSPEEIKANFDINVKPGSRNWRNMFGRLTESTNIDEYIKLYARDLTPPLHTSTMLNMVTSKRWSSKEELLNALISMYRKTYEDIYINATRHTINALSLLKEYTNDPQSLYYLQDILYSQIRHPTTEVIKEIFAPKLMETLDKLDDIGLAPFISKTPPSKAVDAALDATITRAITRSVGTATRDVAVSHISETISSILGNKKAKRYIQIAKDIIQQADKYKIVSNITNGFVSQARYVVEGASVATSTSWTKSPNMSFHKFLSSKRFLAAGLTMLAAELIFAKSMDSITIDSVTQELRRKSILVRLSSYRAMSEALHNMELHYPKTDKVPMSDTAMANLLNYSYGDKERGHKMIQVLNESLIDYKEMRKLIRDKREQNASAYHSISVGGPNKHWIALAGSPYDVHPNGFYMYEIEHNIKRLEWTKKAIRILSNPKDVQALMTHLNDHGGHGGPGSKRGREIWKILFQDSANPRLARAALITLASGEKLGVVRMVKELFKHVWPSIQADVYTELSRQQFELLHRDAVVLGLALLVDSPELLGGPLGAIIWGIQAAMSVREIWKKWKSMHRDPSKNAMFVPQYARDTVNLASPEFLSALKIIADFNLREGEVGHDATINAQDLAHQYWELRKDALAVEFKDEVNEILKNHSKLDIIAWTNTTSKESDSWFITKEARRLTWYLEFTSTWSPISKDDNTAQPQPHGKVMSQANQEQTYKELQEELSGNVVFERINSIEDSSERRLEAMKTLEALKRQRASVRLLVREKIGIGADVLYGEVWIDMAMDAYVIELNKVDTQEKEFAIARMLDTVKNRPISTEQFNAGMIAGYLVEADKLNKEGKTIEARMTLLKAGFEVGPAEQAPDKVVGPLRTPRKITRRERYYINVRGALMNGDKVQEYVLDSNSDVVSPHIFREVDEGFIGPQRGLITREGDEGFIGPLRQRILVEGERGFTGPQRPLEPRILQEFEPGFTGPQRPVMMRPMNTGERIASRVSKLRPAAFEIGLQSHMSDIEIDEMKQKDINVIYGEELNKAYVQALAILGTPGLSFILEDMVPDGISQAGWKDYVQLRGNQQKAYDDRETAIKIFDKKAENAQNIYNGFANTKNAARAAATKVYNNKVTALNAKTRLPEEYAAKEIDPVVGYRVNSINKQKNHLYKDDLKRFSKETREEHERRRSAGMLPGMSRRSKLEKQLWKDFWRVFGDWGTNKDGSKKAAPKDITRTPDGHRLGEGATATKNWPASTIKFKKTDAQKEYLKALVRHAAATNAFWKEWAKYQSAFTAWQDREEERLRLIEEALKKSLQDDKPTDDDNDDEKTDFEKDTEQLKDKALREMLTLVGLGVTFPMPDINIGDFKGNSAGQTFKQGAFVSPGDGVPAGTEDEDEDVDGIIVLPDAWEEEIPEDDSEEDTGFEDLTAKGAEYTDDEHTEPTDDNGNGVPDNLEEAEEAPTPPTGTGPGPVPEAPTRPGGKYAMQYRGEKSNGLTGDTDNQTPTITHFDMTDVDPSNENGLDGIVAPDITVISDDSQGLIGPSSEDRPNNAVVPDRKAAPGDS